MQEHLVIIGGVAAGTKAASKARRENPDLKISIYTDSYHISYSSCSLPYYIEDLVKDKNKLLIRSPEIFKTKFNIDVHIRHKVTRIIPEEKKILVDNLENGEHSEAMYTKLLIATGAHSVIPDIEGIKLNNVFTLRSFTDGIKIKSQVQKSKRAVIVGAGYIGLEMVEAFHNSGLDITLIEMSSQILPLMDEELATQIHKYLEEKNIKIITSDGVKRLISDEDNNVKRVETRNGAIIDADIALISVGAKPNIELAREAGIEIGETGAIKVNSKMQTNIEDIYAAGDCAEQINLITGKPTWVPLGSTANKQGRVAAINITGGNEEFVGVLGSHISKIFEFANAGTGLTEKQANKYGYNYETVTITDKDRSSLFPGAEDFTLKLIADKSTGKLIGAQGIGKGDVDKRINVLATALTAHMTIDDIANIDITYSPPYSPVIDPVIIAAEQLQEKLNGYK